MFQKKNIVRLFIILLLTITIDQITKNIIFNLIFVPNNRIDVNSFLSLTPVWNNGISFGMFSDFGHYGRLIFSTLAIFISIWLMWSSINMPKISSVGFNFIAGGALGNVLDRVIHGKVIDFIDFHFYGFHWPAFNFADIFIFFGILLYMYNEIFISEKQNAK